MSMLLPLLLAGTAQATELTIEGSCPGAMNISVSGTPGAPLVLVAGDADGSTILDRGACAGLDLGLTGSPLRPMTMPPLDGDGILDITPSIPEAACSKKLVAVEVSTCSVSAPARLDGESCDPFDPACAPATTVPTASARDFAYSYWPDNHFPDETWPTISFDHHLLTGHYAAVFHEDSGALTRLGAVDLPDARTAQDWNPADHELLPAIDVHYEVGSVDASAEATAFLSSADPPGLPVDSTTIDHRERLHMIDGGRFMNRYRMPVVEYADAPDTTGKVFLASMPKHLVLTHEASGGEAGSTARIVVGGDAFAGLDVETWHVDGRIVELTDGAGSGWLLAAYDTADRDTELRIDADGSVVVEVTDPAGLGAATASLLMAPSDSLTESDRLLYIDPASAATVTTTLLNLDGGAVWDEAVAAWDPTLGAFRADLGDLQDSGSPWPANFHDEAYHHWHGRHAVSIDTATPEPLAVPIAFFAPERLSWYITGGLALLRDTNGEPTGTPLQMSKNWHEGWPNNWYHLYTQPVVGADPVELELTVASAKWGDVFVASHSQLSLIGWSGSRGARWDESALGCFGESITYNPDSTYRSMQDDVRPFLVDNDEAFWWSGNVGGAEFLRYRDTAQPWRNRRVQEVKTTYTSHGPNMTDVTYSGMSSDRKIEVRASPRLIATDDIVRTYVELEFHFLEDIEYDRLAFFQVAADNYSDNGFTGYAWGNADEVTFEGVVEATGAWAYESIHPRGIELAGDAPWVHLYGNTRIDLDLPEDTASVGFVVRDFFADIGGTLLTTPYVSIYSTNNGGSPQYSFELGLPYDEGAEWCGDPCGGRRNFVPAGSSVYATVEYVVPPSGTEVYYGPSEWLNASDTGMWDTPAMMQMIARDGTISASAGVGELRTVYPLVVDTMGGAVAGELTLSGGLGYRPVSFAGLVRPDGWQLQRLEGDAWVDVDTSSAVGNDSWQAVHDELANTWTLIYSVPVGLEQTIRLTWTGA